MTRFLGVLNGFFGGWMKGCVERRCEGNNPGLRSPESKHKDVSRPLCLKNTPTLHNSPRAGYQPGGTHAPFYPATAPNCQAPAANENKVHSQGRPQRAPAQTPRPGADSDKVDARVQIFCPHEFNSTVEFRSRVKQAAENWDQLDWAIATKSYKTNTGLASGIRALAHVGSLFPIRELNL
ncbi:unnamed protein product [Rangifer tarandus platyrhynchus]|uniref:Uncharacterized protein n=1 Tax=Rangifer tarandus platyrhynchus TaxID=3082113 RepID=A0ABN8Z1L0_RANTA|nr:unnamed protein product [Rangifer tarandus platyrhynchus]